MSSTSGGRSVGVIRVRNKSQGVVLFIINLQNSQCPILNMFMSVFQTGSAMTAVRGNEDSDNNFSDDESTPLYGGR
jgi:hypothetical protein